MENIAVTNSLPQMPLVGGVYPTLVKADGSIAWRFQYNPEVLVGGLVVNNVPTTVLYRSDGTPTYSYTDAETLQFKDVWLYGHTNSRTVESLLQELLLLSHPAEGTNELPRVYFMWGARTWGAGVIDGSVTWNETAWLNGVPADVTVSFTLRRVYDVESGAASVTDTPNITEAPLVPTATTTASDSLELLSFSTYNNTEYWRELADTNNLDLVGLTAGRFIDNEGDLRRTLEPGMVLELPALNTVRDTYRKAKQSVTQIQRVIGTTPGNLDLSTVIDKAKGVFNAINWVL